MSDDIASRMYGGSDSQQGTSTLTGGSGTDTPQPTEPRNQGEPGRSFGDIASTLYPEPKPEQLGNPYALEADDTADKLYGAEDRVSLEGVDLTGLLEPGAGEQEVAEASETLGHMATGAGATADDVSSLVSIANEYTEPRFAESEADRHQTISEALAPYGGDQSKLQDARDLVASYPEWEAWLAQTGAGDDPRVVRKMLSLAQTSRGQARIAQYRRTRK